MSHSLGSNYFAPPPVILHLYFIFNRSRNLQQTVVALARIDVQESTIIDFRKQQIQNLKKTHCQDPVCDHMFAGF
jgi:hypothetical protein